MPCLGPTIFQSAKSQPRNPETEKKYASFILDVYGMMYEDQQWRELFDMPDLDSYVKIVRDILIDEYKEKVKAVDIERARKLIGEGKLERPEALQLFGLTDEEL
jgi:hypothetical protein